MEVYRHKGLVYVMLTIAASLSLQSQTAALPVGESVVAIAGGHNAVSPSVGILITSLNLNNNSPPPVIIGPRPTSRPVISGPISNPRPGIFEPFTTIRPFTRRPAPLLGCHPGSPFYPRCLYR